MKTAIVPLSEIARTSGLVLSAERYLLSDADLRQDLLTRVQARIAPLLAEREAIERADSAELRRRYAQRFWGLRGR